LMIDLSTPRIFEIRTVNRDGGNHVNLRYVTPLR
jgi:hypothetical protein